MWETKYNFNGNRYDIMNIPGSSPNCPSQFIMITNEFDSFYINYNIGFNPVYRNVQIHAETWEEARMVARCEVNKYIEKQRLYWQAIGWQFDQVIWRRKNNEVV